MIGNLAIRQSLFVLACIACLSTYLPPSWALVLGLIMNRLIGKPFEQLTHKHTTLLLQIAIVGVGFGMNASNVMEAGRLGLVFTVISVLSVISVGVLLGKLLRSDPKISYLISLGTAICGGSAIAAISPIVKADENQISVSLGTVFVLNAVALLTFPLIGEHWFHLSQLQFGMWSAIAIHDTSSVVGSASEYGLEALEVATSVKLLRTLWIVPMAIFSAFVFKSESRIKIPWFIGFFIIAIISNTYLDWIPSVYIVTSGKAVMSLVLFLIGAGLSMSTLRTVGVMPFLQGIILWLGVSILTLVAIIEFI